MAGEGSSNYNNMNLESLFESYDKLWDPTVKEHKVIKSSENQPIRPPSNTLGDGLAFYSLKSFEKDGKTFQKALVIVSTNLCEVLNIALRDQRITVIPKQSKLSSRALYHYLDDFRNFNFSLDLSIPALELSQTHLAALIYFLEIEHESDRLFADTLLAMHPPYITYELSWLLFKPKILVFGSTQSPRTARLYRSRGLYVECDHNRLNLRCEYITSSVSGAVVRSVHLTLYHFEGARKVSELDIVPFELLPSRTMVGIFLEERGRRYIDICRKGKQYISDSQDTFDDGHRFVIGTEGYEMGKSGDNELPAGDLDAIYYQLCDCHLSGYSIKNNTWKEIHVNDITDIVWKEEMLANLVLDPNMKTIIKGLVGHHNSVDSQSLRDVMPGNGMGLIMLFSGPPGIGKTLTAVEAVAEATHRPIHRISPSDLSSEPEELEEMLSDILKRGVKWDLVLLLDEADVFLEQRTSFDVKRNSLISIFLRQLENYRGILILTTNRVETFDKALESMYKLHIPLVLGRINFKGRLCTPFMSRSTLNSLYKYNEGRVHFNFRFPELNKNLRMQLWQFFLEGRFGGISLREVIQLSELKFNGRMIKNAVSLAIALSKIQNESLSYTHIRSCLPFIDPSLSIERQSSTRLNDYNYASPLDPWMTPGQITDGESPGGPSPAGRGSKRPRRS